MTRTELLQIAKPILFNTEMVMAILDGRKNCTRRVINHDNNGIWSAENDCRNSEYGASVPCYLSRKISVDDTSPNVIYPKYDVGDYLYVRETWAENNFGLFFRADYPQDNCPEMDCNEKWHPSIHMPKVDARIFLRVTDVRVERLQDITNVDILREGSHDLGIKGANVDYFANYVWDSTIKKQDLDRFGWDANPWVWVIEFERVNVDE